MTSQLVLQFSTCAPQWRPWVPQQFRDPRKLFCIVGDRYWATPLVRRMSHSPFSHCDAVLPDGNLLGASDNPNAPTIKGNPRGVAIRPPSYQPFRYRRRMILQTDRADDVIAIALTQLGKDFDNSGLREFFSDEFPDGRNWRLDSHWWCSELFAWAMEAGQFWPHPLAWPKARVSPTDLLLVCLTDPRWTNRDTFWMPVPGLKLGEGET